ncbi:MAG TPA: hypothetical protein VFU05_10525 [Cyclobacteriaceae bacterium]|nr:hypothetical protein [Cyclobacteriaceae bacterium]
MKSLFRHKILTLFAGIATAGVIVFSQLFYFQAANYCQKKAETEQHDQKKDGSGTETHISIPSSSISSSSHIELTHDLSFILEALFESEPKEEEVTSITIPVNRFFQTLFRFIISPNAP